MQKLFFIFECLFLWQLIIIVMENTSDKIFAIVDNDCRLALTTSGKKKIEDLLKTEVINKAELEKIVYDNPNDMELGRKIRELFIS